ncbi:phage tail family protein [Streptomyces sp. S12]|nr:phage tail family protein [Streptomyces sp. S12]
MTVAVQALGRIQWGGLVFGPGTPYTVTAVEGLDDLPSIRSEDVDRPGEHGEYTGPDFTGARVVQVKLGLRGQSPNDLRALSLALQAATQPQRQPAPLAFLDQDRLLMAKVRKRNIPYDAEYLWRLGDAALEFYCADPYLYGLEQKTQVTTAYSPSAGRTYPLVYSGTGEPATNLVLNPSAEVDLTNTVSLGANIARARTTAEARYGTASVECTHTSGTASQAGNLWLIEPQVEGTVLRSSLWVKVISGAPTSGYMAFRAGTAAPHQVPITTVPGPGSWVRLDALHTVQPGEVIDRIGVALNGATGTVWRADGIMCETGTVLHQYVDGDQLGCVWNGTPHASTSSRLPGTNRDYGPAGVSGRITLTNDGASPAYPVLRIDGPVANPAIEHVTAGGSLTIDATLQAGEHLLIDTRSRAVLLMGTSPRRSWVRAGSSWPLIHPGRNELAYRASALPGGSGQPSLLTVTWRDTSL